MVLQIIQPGDLNHHQIVRPDTHLPSRTVAIRVCLAESIHVDAVVNDLDALCRNPLVGDHRLAHGLANAHHAIVATHQ